MSPIAYAVPHCPGRGWRGPGNAQNARLAFCSLASWSRFSSWRSSDRREHTNARMALGLGRHHIHLREGVHVLTGPPGPPQRISESAIKVNRRAPPHPAYVTLHQRPELLAHHLRARSLPKGPVEPRTPVPVTHYSSHYRCADAGLTGKPAHAILAPTMSASSRQVMFDAEDIRPTWGCMHPRVCIRLPAGLRL